MKRATLVLGAILLTTGAALAHPQQRRATLNTPAVKRGAIQKMFCAEGKAAS